MKRLFISQPMVDRTDEEIISERKVAIAEAKKLLNEDIEVIDSFTSVQMNPLGYLGYSITCLSKADVAYFAKGWQDYKDIVYADGKTKLFDQYPSCKHWEKKYCQCKPKRYRGYVTPGGYVFFGDSEIEIYCKVIAAFGNEESPLIIPFSEM